MQYKGIELVEITEPQIFDPPKTMVVWRDDGKEPIIDEVIAIFAKSCNFQYRVVLNDCSFYSHCAFIPEKPAPRMATNRELSKWLAQGNGQVSKVEDGVMYTSSSWDYHRKDDSFVKEEYRLRVRKWDDTDWHEPTIDYLGLE